MHSVKDSPPRATVCVTTLRSLDLKQRVLPRVELSYVMCDVRVCCAPGWWWVCGVWACIVNMERHEATNHHGFMNRPRLRIFWWLRIIDWLGQVISREDLIMNKPPKLKNSISDFIKEVTAGRGSAKRRNRWSAGPISSPLSDRTLAKAFVLQWTCNGWRPCWCCWWW